MRGLLVQKSFLKAEINLKKGVILLLAQLLSNNSFNKSDLVDPGFEPIWSKDFGVGSQSRIVNLRPSENVGYF